MSNYHSRCRKHRFRDHKEAVAFLHHAHSQRLRAGADGTSTRRRECRDYECFRCNGFHVTSQASHH